MSENKNKGSLIEAIGPAASNFGKEIAPLGTETGKLVVLAFEKVKAGINTGFAIKDATWAYFKSKLNERLQMEKPEDIIVPKFSIAGPTLEYLRFISEEDKALQNMFIGLFASSMLKSSQSKAHPSFVEALKQMSSDEAKIIKHVYNLPSKSFPCVSINSEMANGFTTIQECFSTIGMESGCDKANHANIYIKNLDRLGIFKHMPDTHFSDAKKYEELVNTVALIGYDKEYEFLIPGSKTIVKKGLVKLTEYGLMFCSVCVKE